MTLRVVKNFIIDDRPKAIPPLALTTWEQRKLMTAAELVTAMGALHVSHADFKARPLSLLPMPNIAGRNGPVIEGYDPGFFGQVAALFRMAVR